MAIAPDKEYPPYRILYRENIEDERQELFEGSILKITNGMILDVFNTVPGIEMEET